MLRFGCATRDITPDRPVWLGGYAGRDGPSTGVSEPILAGCIALQTGEGQAAGGEPALLVTLDLVGVHDAGARALAGRIAEATGVPVERILLACSHTHYAPAVGLQRIYHPDVGRNGINDADPAYVGEMSVKVVEACAEAVRRLAPGTLEVLRTSVPQVHYNRRIRQRDGSVVTTFRYPTGSDSDSRAVTHRRPPDGAAISNRRLRRGGRGSRSLRLPYGHRRSARGRDVAARVV